MKKFLIFVLPALLLISCDSGKVFQRFEDIPNNVWTKENTITFEVDIQDTAPAYDVELAVRHSIYYVWANIVVHLNVQYPSGEVRTKEVEFFVRNTDGSFKGEGAGDLFDINFPWMEDVTFPEKGKYIFTVQNAMPQVETEDVMQIGLIVRKAGE
jgi:gliding motility-associated lipoprotein GldH